VIWSPSRAREEILALAMERDLDGASIEAAALRRYARKGRLGGPRSVFEKVLLIVGPTRANALIAEIRS
jgi:hypothetical protein